MVGIYLHKVKNRNTRTRCEICSKLIIKTPERRRWRLSGVLIVNFERISHLLLVFLLLTLNIKLLARYRTKQKTKNERKDTQRFFRKDTITLIPTDSLSLLLYNYCY